MTPRGKGEGGKKSQDGGKGVKTVVERTDLTPRGKGEGGKEEPGRRQRCQDDAAEEMLLLCDVQSQQE